MSSVVYCQEKYDKRKLIAMTTNPDVYACYLISIKNQYINTVSCLSNKYKLGDFNPTFLICVCII